MATYKLILSTLASLTDCCLIAPNQYRNRCSPLHWRHNECDGVSNHQPHDCLLNRLFKAQIKENIKAPRHWPLWGPITSVSIVYLTICSCTYQAKPRVTGLCEGNSSFTGEFPTQRASNAENVSIWCLDHDLTWKVFTLEQTHKKWSRGLSVTSAWRLHFWNWLKNIPGGNDFITWNLWGLDWLKLILLNAV